ncbi:MAG: Wzz/FepE/Etk N-terminal domain-containing protein [Jatrophihabitantaceae bacterium]
MSQIVNGNDVRQTRLKVNGAGRDRPVGDALQQWGPPTDTAVSEPWSSAAPPQRRDLVRIVHNQRWWILAFVVVAVALATLYTYSRAPSYRSSADVLVQPRVFAAGTVPQAPDMGSEKAAAGSTTVLTIAAQTLGVSVSTLSDGLTISVPLNTHVLHIAYAAGSAQTARDRAQAVADAYVSYWLTLQPDLSGVSGATTRSRIVPTEVITPATVPTSPSSPNHLTDLTLATIIALLLAFGTAYLRDRFDDRLSGPQDAERTAGTGVIAVLPRQRHTDRSGLPALGTSPRTSSAAYHDLASLVLDAVADRHARSILITGPTGSAHSAIAANLAVSLARTGRRVALFFAERAAQSGGVSADYVRGAAADLPELQVLEREAKSGEFDATELRQLVRRLCSTSDIVVVVGPAALVGANVRALVDAADLLVISAETRRTTRTQLRTAMRRLRPARSKVVGVVLQKPHGARLIRRGTSKPDRPAAESEATPRPPSPGRPAIDGAAVGIGPRPTRSGSATRRDQPAERPANPARPLSTEK